MPSPLRRDHHRSAAGDSRPGIDELLISHVIVEDEASELEVLSRILADTLGASSS